MPDTLSLSQPQQHAFNPYTENGGTILAIAGADFSVIAGDTRQSEGYNIQTRYAPKVFRLYAYLPLSSLSNLMPRMLIAFCCRTDKAVLAVNGFAADGNMFVKKVRQRLEVRSVRNLCLTCAVKPHLVRFPVVSTRACQRYANPRYCPPDPNDVILPTFFPILCIQYPWRH